MLLKFDKEWINWDFVKYDSKIWIFKTRLEYLLYLKKMGIKEERSLVYMKLYDLIHVSCVHAINEVYLNPFSDEPVKVIRDDTYFKIVE